MLFAVQGYPSARDPAATEAEGGGRGDAFNEQHSSPAGGAPSLNDGSPAEEAARHDGGEEGNVEGEGTGEGGEKGDKEEGVPAEGRYRYYILSQEEAAAEASSPPKASGVGGAGDGRLSGRYNYVIIGEGAAADAAVESILRMQPEAEILFLSDETVRA